MLHHINPVSGLLAAALFLSAPVQAALPAYSAVKDEAKTVNKYMIVVWAGTDWSPKSREITRAVEHLAKNTPEPVLWCIQDEREEMTEEEQKLPKPPGEIWNIPALQVVSPTGNMVFLSEGVLVALHIEGLGNAQVWNADENTHAGNHIRLPDGRDGQGLLRAALFRQHGLDQLVELGLGKAVLRGFDVLPHPAGKPSRKRRAL